MIEHSVVENPDNGGSGVYRIVSPKLKEILEQFHLPPHRFYPAEVTHEITDEKRPYYLFHLTYEGGDYLNNAYWPVMESTIYKEGGIDNSSGLPKNDEILHKLDKGTMSDYSHFQQLYKEYIRNREGIALDKELDLDNEEDYELWSSKLSKYNTREYYYIFREPLDLMGFGTDIIISKLLKDEIQKNFPDKGLCLEFPNMMNIITNYQLGETLPF